MTTLVSPNQIYEDTADPGVLHAVLFDGGDVVVYPQVVAPLTFDCQTTDNANVRGIFYDPATRPNGLYVITAHVVGAVDIGGGSIAAVSYIVKRSGVVVSGVVDDFSNQTILFADSVEGTIDDAEVFITITAGEFEVHVVGVTGWIINWHGLITVEFVGIVGTGVS